MNVALLSGGQLVAHFLMASYLYYRYDTSVIPDSDFDSICKRLLEEWDQIEHPHKHLISRGDLEAGSGFALKDYPAMVQGAAWHWYRSNELLERESKIG